MSSTASPVSIAQALQEMHAGNITQGLTILTTLSQEPQTRAEALGHRAWAYRVLGRWDESLGDYDAYLAERPGDLEAAALRAELLGLAGRPREALAGAVAVLQQDPTHNLAVSVLLRCRQALGLAPAGVLAPPEAQGAAADGDNLALGLDPAAACKVPRFPYFQILRGRLRFPSRYDYYEHYLRTHVRGKRVLDLGAMWLVDGRFSFYAESCGAAEVVAFDIIPPSAKFLAEAERRHSRVRPVQGDMMDAAVMARLGSFDVVFCSGVLYHLPDPALALRRLRSLCRGEAMIGTAVIREGLTRNRAVYYPYQDALSRRWWNFGSKEQKLALDTPYAPQLDYANWFWGMSPSCVAALLQTRGFKVDHIHYRLHFAYFECSVPPVGPEPRPGLMASAGG